MELHLLHLNKGNHAFKKELSKSNNEGLPAPAAGWFKYLSACLLLVPTILKLKDDPPHRTAKHFAHHLNPWPSLSVTSIQPNSEVSFTNHSSPNFRCQISSLPLPTSLQNKQKNLIISLLYVIDRTDYNLIEALIINVTSFR